MRERLWEIFVSLLMNIFLPIICFYHALCGSLFLNVSVTEATGLEKTGNILLIPFQYLFAGKEASLKDDGSWEIVQKFEYTRSLLPKTIACIAVLPPSLILGSALKGLSYLGCDTYQRHISLLAHFKATETQPNSGLYSRLGLNIGNYKTSPLLPSQGYLRRPGDENHLQKAKEGLRDIARVLTDAGIPWWVDCGTLLGAYRYGGVIPWDNDIDIAVLLPDFENTRRALNRLDTNKYMVQDWSGRDFPSTFFKIYVHETGDMIDIYFYEIDEEAKVCKYIFALDTSVFFFDWWKEGERRFKKPIAFDHLFPLKRTLFDGVEVFVPNEPVPFLQRYYGENLAPAKIYNAQTNRFEKDLSHPYWQNPFVH